jgi:DNA-binding response OmpR family regulator
LQAPTILLVEDEALIEEILTAEFADTGFEVVAASDGNQAIAELDADATR